jgi:hypothetical protein
MNDTLLAIHSKTHQIHGSYSQEKEEITTFTISASQQYIAVGYAHGLLVLLDKTMKEVCRFSAHKSAITTIIFTSNVYFYLGLYRIQWKR